MPQQMEVRASVACWRRRGYDATSLGSRGPPLPPAMAPLCTRVSVHPPPCAEDDDGAADAAGASGAEAQPATIEPSARSTLGACVSRAAAASPGAPPSLLPRLSRSAAAPAVPIEVESDLTASWTRSSGRLREALLDAMVTVTLSETETVMLFELPSVRVQQDSAESRLVSRGSSSSSWVSPLRQGTCRPSFRRS